MFTSALSSPERTAGNYQLSVTNPDPGGVSNEQTFTVVSPAPTISAISPSPKTTTSFLSVDFSNVKYIIAMVVFFLLVGFMYVRSNLIYTNPVLNLLGYDLYEIEDNKENTMVLITKEKDLKKEFNVKVINIGKNIYLGE